MGTLGRVQAKKCHTYSAHHSSRADILKDGDVESKKKTENISWGNVWSGVRSDGKPLRERSCPTGDLSRRIPRISSLSCGGLPSFRPTTVHSRWVNLTTTNNNETNCIVTFSFSRRTYQGHKICQVLMWDYKTCCRYQYRRKIWKNLTCSLDWWPKHNRHNTVHYTRFKHTLTDQLKFITQTQNGLSMPMAAASLQRITMKPHND